MQHDELQHCSAHHRRPPASSHKADMIKEISATMSSDSHRASFLQAAVAVPAQQSHKATQPSHPYTHHDRARDGHDLPCPCALLLVCYAPPQSSLTATSTASLCFLKELSAPAYPSHACRQCSRYLALILDHCVGLGARLFAAVDPGGEHFAFAYDLLAK